MFGQFSRHCRNLILSKSFMHLGITIKDKLQNVWPVYTFTLDGLKGYVLITQYIFIIRWTPMDFPSGWCHPLGMCLLSLEIMTFSLLGCQQWISREFFLSSILYLLQFSETVLKIKRVYSFSTTRLNWNIFHIFKRCRTVTFGNFSM